jgi:hypothetical protein
MLIAKAHPTTASGQGKQPNDRERDPFAPAVPTEPFALIHAALCHPWDQLKSATNAACATPNKNGATQWPSLPEHSSLYSSRSVAFMASWLNANMAVKVPLKGLKFLFYLPTSL